MIIQVRGTSGSGKSTIVSKILDANVVTPFYSLDEIEHFVKPRSIPLYYLADKFVVLGNYEKGSGGCDTIGTSSGQRSSPAIFKLLQVLSNKHKRHILCEGLLLSEDVIWTEKITWDEVRMIFLTTTVQECLQRIQRRRQSLGKDPTDFNKNKTRERYGVIERARLRLVASGKFVRRMNTEQATEAVKKWLKESYNR